MKDYRQYSKAYKYDEWESDKTWLAQRLEFLWTFSDYYPQLYLERRLCDEKETMYLYHGSDNEIATMARDFHYNQYNQYSNKYKFDIKDCNKLIRTFVKLQQVKNNDMDTFLRKRFYIRYNYLEEFIHDYLDEEYCDYLNERR